MAALSPQRTGAGRTGGPLYCGTVPTPRGPTVVRQVRLPAQTVRAILSRTRFVPAVVNPPFPPRYVAIPYRPRGRGGRPLFFRQTVPGIAPTIPPIAFNLNAWACLIISSDSDPLAVDPGGAVVVASDGDPLAVDPYGAIPVSSDGDPIAVDPSQAIQVN